MSKELPDDVFLVPVEVSETRSSFVVVRLRASSLEEAQQRAVEDVEQLCRADELDDLFDYPGGDWEHEEFECRGIAEVEGDVSDYNVDIDKVQEPTRAEHELAERQVVLPLEGD